MKDAFYWEARRICNRHGIEADEPEHCENIAASLRYHAFRDAIQPFLDMKVRIMALAIPRWTFSAGDGSFEIVNDGVTDEMRAALAAVDEVIDYLKRRYEK